MDQHINTSEIHCAPKDNSGDALFQRQISTHLQEVTREFTDQPPSHPLPEYMTVEELLEQSRIRLTDRYELPPTCLEIVTDDSSSVFGTLGNFSLVIGKAKSKKTFLITIALSAAVRNDTILDKVRAILPEEKRGTVFFDTEQARFHVHKLVNRVAFLSEDPTLPNFQCFGLRSFPPDLRVRVIEHALENIKGIGVVVIDGIRDLVRDINDPNEASRMVNLLMKWSEEKNIHIIAVLHQNKGDNNARGHLGTELVNKAESVISVTKDTKDPLISIVEPEFCREKEFPAFAFRIDGRGLPYVIKGWTPPKQGAKKSTLNPYDFPSEFHIPLLKAIFQNKGEELGYGEFWTKVKVAALQHGTSMGENKAKEWLGYYEERQLVTAERRGNKKFFRLSEGV